MSNEILAIYDEEGQRLDDIRFQVRAGYGSIRRFIVQNVHVYPIRLSNPTPTSKDVNVILYPNDVLKPGAKGIMDLEYSAPPDEKNLIIGQVEFDAEIVAIG